MVVKEVEKKNVWMNKVVPEAIHQNTPDKNKKYENMTFFLFFLNGLPRWTKMFYTKTEL